MADSRYYENRRMLVIIEKLSNYDEIWYNELDSDFKNHNLTKIEIFKYKMADGRHIEIINNNNNTRTMFMVLSSC